jgi:stage II sporulation protein AA (anti-sigma F factor antagonist)
MDGDFGTELIHLNGDAVLMVRGEVDASTSPMLHDVCLDLASICDRLVLDLSGVTFIDSAALHVLIQLHQREGTNTVVRNPSSQVRRLLQITELASRFLEPSVSETDVADAAHAEASEN